MVINWPTGCLAFAATFAIVLAVTIRTRMRNSAARPFAIGMLIAALWCVDYALELGTPDFGQKIELLKLRTLFLPFYAPLWFEVAHRFVFGRKFFHGWRLLAGATIPVVTAVVAWVPRPPSFLVFRHDFWLEPVANYQVLRFAWGPWAIVFVSYTVVVVAAMFCVLWISLRTGSWDRMARLFFFTACIIGGVMNLLFAFDRRLTHGINYAPVLSPLTFGLVTLGLLRGRVIRLAPVGRGMLLDSLEDLLVVLDGSDRIVDLNRAAARALGTSPERAQGKPYAEVLAAWPEAAARLSWEEGGKDEVSLGGILHEMNVVLVQDRAGALEARIVTLRDITDRKRIEAELRRAKEAAESADEAKSRFLAMISHEIRTPMNAVVGFTHLLQATPINEEQRGYLDLIAQGGRALLVIIDDVLDYTKITSGRLALEEAPFRPEEIAARTCRLLEPRAAHKKIALELRVDSGVPPAVIGDSVRFGQVLTNLIGNAIKFTDRGGITVEIFPAKEADQPGCRGLRVSVRDTGIGISPDALERIFQPFSQADNSITRRFGGTGLGLAISKRLCILMGGDLTVESIPGRGSAFTALLRFATAVEGVAAAPSAAAPPPPQNFPGLNILVFEDNRLNQRVISALLSKAGHRVRIASSGPEGLDLIGSERFDAVLMDIEMPGMDGYETVRLIRQKENGARHRVIALTAHAMTGMREKCLASGMDDFLTKPIDPGALAEALRRCRLS